MKTRARIAFAVVAVVCLAVLAIGVVRVVRESTPARVRMTDGTMLYIRGVYLGTNEFRTDTPIKTLARRVLPRQWSMRWLGAPITMQGDNSYELHIAFVRMDTAGRKLPDFWRKIETVDSKGVVYTESVGSSTYGNNELLEFSLSTFPRREEKFLLRIYDSTGPLRAEFMVKNPLLHREFPVWKPEPIPQTKTNEGVRITLKGLKADKNDYGPYCNPDLNIESDDPGWRSGKHMYHTFADATGNKGAFLSTNEPVWRTHVALYRPDGAVFPSNYVWQLPLVEIPAALSYTNLQASNRVDGVAMWVPIICGAGTLTISNYTNFSVAAPIANNGWGYTQRAGTGTVERHAEDKPFVLVETATITDESELVIRFIDAKGKTLKSNYRGGWNGASDPKRGLIRRYTVELVDTNVEAAAVEIKLNRPLDFEFMIDPREIKAK